MSGGPPQPGPNVPRSRLDGLEGALVEAFQAQGAALVAEVRSLGVTFESVVGELRAEARSTRLWMAGLVALAILVLGGVVGVSVTLEGDRIETTAAP